MEKPDNRLPQRVVRLDFGRGPKHPAAVYTAPIDVLERFLAALKAWDPSYTAEIEPVGYPNDDIPLLPMWKLWTAE